MSEKPGAELPLPLVLASASPRRRELLASLGLKFRVLAPQIPEDGFPGEMPRARVRRLSREKAAAAAAMLDTPALILAADTLVIDGETALGKPADIAAARRMLWRMRGRAHEVCTAFTLLRMDDGRERTRLASTRVRMRAYSAKELESWLAGGAALDKAGAYAIQDARFAPALAIEGSYSNVVGLPLEALRTALAKISLPVQA